MTEFDPFLLLAGCLSAAYDQPAPTANLLQERNGLRFVEGLSADKLRVTRGGVRHRFIPHIPAFVARYVVEMPVLLLVEDDAVVSMFTGEALRDGGYSVVVAVSGQEAFQALEGPSAKFCGLVTDVRLGPGPDGWEVGRHARQHQADLPVVYVTANAAGEWVANGVPNSLLLQKPYAPAQLLAALSTLIKTANSREAI